MILLVFIILNIVFALFVLFLLLAFFTGAPFVPTSPRVVKEMILLARLTKRDIVVDLGCGDGRLLIEAAKRGARAFGWDINPFLVFIATVNAFLLGVNRNMTVRWGDYRRQNITMATVVLVYSIAGRHIRVIEEKLMGELPKGTRVLSYRFAFSRLKFLKKTKTGIYVYRV